MQHEAGWQAEKSVSPLNGGQMESFLIYLYDIFCKCVKSVSMLANYELQLINLKL